MSGDIVFSFNDIKTTQAAAFLIKLHGQPSMSYLGLLKMLYIKKVFVTLIADPGDDELSLAEEEIMEAVYQEFGHLNPFDVAEWTHSLPEWINPQEKGQKVVDIKVVDLLQYLKKSDDEIQRIKEIADRERYLDGVLNG